jgi:hypothetical protein
MKRLLILSASLVVAGSLIHQASAQTTVTSVNVVGFQVADVPGTNLAMYAFPFVPIDGDNSLTNLLASELTAGINVGAGDNILVWNAAGANYQTSYKKTTLGWTDNGFTPSTRKLDIGRGFWVKSNNPIDQSVNFSGEVVTDNVVTQQILTGLNMVAYPYNAEVNITNTALDGLVQTGINVGAADNILVWQGSSYVTYFKKTTLGWTQNGFTPATVTLKMGQGFWFNRKGANFSWEETKPYSL